MRAVARPSGAALLATFAGVVAIGACNESIDLFDPTLAVPPPPDQSWVPPQEDLPPPNYNECGDVNQTCTMLQLGPPFRLSSDPDADPLEHDEGLRRDLDGYLSLSQSGPGPDLVWIANDADPLLGGTVSKIDSRAVRELARYPSVTCYSNATGSRKACDGVNGCCSADDWERWQARKPTHQAVQTTANNPSRVAVDFTGDVYVSNRAFGGQSSVTHITAATERCIDRNANGRIDTSSDVNANGLIEVDCNGDGLPDDAESVARKPCSNGAQQEYFGLDDECVLWTTNTFRPKAVGRPIALVNSFDVEDPWNEEVDVWAGSYATGAYARIRGATGRYADDVQLPDECWKQGTGPYGVVIDAGGIGWSVSMGQGRLCYFEARELGANRAGSVRDPDWGQMEGYGVTLDRENLVWVGGGVARYAPDRSGGFGALGAGWWTRIQGLAGNGIAADTRSPGAWFVWSCNGQGSVLQIPASAIPPAHADQIVVPGKWPSIRMPCYGVGVDSLQNLWGIDKVQGTRALVDRLGNIAQPTVNGPPFGNNKCPAGSSCPNPGAYTYSDFSGFGFRNFTAPRGFYSYVVRSRCLEQNPTWGTRWIKAEWERELPGAGSFSVRVRNGDTSMPDGSWSPFTQPATAFAIDLSRQPDSKYLELQFGFGTSDVQASPVLKGARLFYECIFEK